MRSKVCEVEDCEKPRQNNHSMCQSHWSYANSVVLKEAKPVMTPDGYFRSVTTAARHFGVDTIIITANLRDGVEGWSYLLVE